MATKTTKENPTVVDTIKFTLLTPNADDCFLSNPYRVDRAVIYYAEKDFAGPNFSNHEIEILEADIKSDLDDAKALLCSDSSNETLQLNVTVLEQKLADTKKSTIFFFKHATPVQIFGFIDPTGATADFPAWLDPTQVPAADVAQVTQDNILTNVETGEFELIWEPLGMREGEYFICWEWTPNIAGDSLKDAQTFSLGGSTALTTVIPTHFTDPTKYDILMERYLPNMFKDRLCVGDLTPEVLQELNKSVGKGFTFLEDLANQMVDLLDANATSEGLLNLLGNMFNLRLKSGDPTRWRRQIKQAIPVYKKKGTLGGLEESLDQAGMSLIKFTRLWQVISKYTWQEVFDVVSTETSFTLTKDMILPVDLNNFEIYHRGDLDSTYTQLTSDYISFDNSNGETTMTWIGDQLSFNPILLEAGDSIRVLYEITNVPDPTEQTIEDYIRNLLLQDQRDERDQTFPKKNWNVRVIEEDDAMFDVVIPQRHPFHDPVVFGKVRTEFPYSENIYNMEEYNGSKRDSNFPCDIDNNFIDPCRYCQGSNFNIDVEIEELSNDRVLEVQDILDENVPFHSLLHAINFSGNVNEFQPVQQEEIEALIQYSFTETVLAGEGQYLFNRVIPLRVSDVTLKRNLLADSANVVTSASGTASNDEIVLASPNVRLDKWINETSVAGAPLVNSNWLEILAPHTNAGDYSVDNGIANHADIAAASVAITEPINTSQFTFRLSNLILTHATAGITQDDLFTFNDVNVNFATLSVKSQFDVDNIADYTGGVWTLTISSAPGAGTYNILNVLPDGILVLDDPTDLLPTANTSSMIWTLEDDLAANRASSTVGSLSVRRRGRVDFSGVTGLDDIRNLSDFGSDYILYSGTQYKVISYGAEDSTTGFTTDVLMDGYTAGDAAGVSVSLYRRIVDDEVGLLDYKGLTLTTLVDHESALTIQNGVNAPVTPLEDNLFKENFLVVIDTDYYVISEIDGTTITLGGPMQSWETSGNPVGTGSGSAVTYDVLKYTKQTVSIPARGAPPIPGHEFDGTSGLSSFIDRRGNEVIDIDIESGGVPMMALAQVLNTADKDDQMIEMIRQQEKIDFQIEWADGAEEQGEV